MKLNSKDLHELCEVTTKAAEEAGKYIQSRFDQSYETSRKTGGDTLASQVVTEVDLRAQEIILNQLKTSIQNYDLGLLTEEAIDDQSRHTKDYFWCIDPMDGTLPFTEHRSGYAVSIALISQAGDPIIGVVYVPDESECYSAVQGEGVQKNGLSFTNREVLNDDKLHWYMDRSFQSSADYDVVGTQMDEYARLQHRVLQIHVGFGAVRNALGVMTSKTACYFKNPKKKDGGGSIWDFAATRLLFEELGLHVSNAKGDRLHLNDQETTFMNDQGVLYATDKSLADFFGEKVQSIHESD